MLLDWAMSLTAKPQPRYGGWGKPSIGVGLAVLIIAVLGCSDSLTERGETVHPVASDLASSRFPQFLRSDTASTEEVRFLESLSRPLSSSAIGVLDGNPDLIFGRLAGAVIVRDTRGERRLILLDIATAEILLFTMDGRPMARAGGFGEGPGEIASPASLGSGRMPGEIVVADHFGKLHTFRIEADSLVYSSRLNIGIPIDMGCMVGPQWVVMTAGTARDTLASANPTLFLVDTAGAVPQGFGVPYYSRDPIARYWYSAGHLECSAEAKMVFAAYMRLGEVHAFSAEGNRIWIRRIPGFSLVSSFYNSRSRAFAYDQNYRGVLDMIDGLATVGSRFLAVRVLSTDYSESPAVSSDRTLWMRSQDGAVLGSLPKGVSVLGGDNSHVVLYSEDPYPRFDVRPLSLVSTAFGSMPPKRRSSF